MFGRAVTPGAGLDVFTAERDAATARLPDARADAEAGVAVRLETRRADV